MDAAAQEAENKPRGQVGGIRADLPLLAALVMLAVALRGWQLAHTEVASRDSIGYIRIAWQLEHGDWAAVMRQAPQHPGYPLAVLGVSRLVRPFTDRNLAAVMQWSAQLASALASVLLVVPVFYLGRELFDRRVGFWAAVFLQCLPTSGRGMADGLSEPAFLLAASAALASACSGLRTGSAWSLARAGLFGGLAYLCRPEGGLIVAFTGLVLLAAQAVPRWRQPWRRVLLGGAGLSVAALSVGGPYAWAIGGLTNKHTGRVVLQHAGLDLEPAALGRPAGGSPLLAVWWRDPGTTAEQRTGWSFVTLLEVLSKGFFYIFWLPALAGLWWFRDRFRLVPGAWVLLLLCTAILYLLYRVAQLLGYLSDRHTLLIILCGSFFTVAALCRLGEMLAAGLARLRPGLAGTRWTDARRWSPAVLGLALAAPLPRTLEPLHAERVGFRTAGYWLAEHTLPGDAILDPYCWASYYAGRVFTEGQSHLPARRPRVHYLVVEDSQNKHPRLPEHEAVKKRALQGKRLVSWQVPRGKEMAEVAIYQWPTPAEERPQ